MKNDQQPIPTEIHVQLRISLHEHGWFSSRVCHHFRLLYDTAGKQHVLSTGVVVRCDGGGFRAQDVKKYVGAAIINGISR
jgi:hypothetical protein